jgi:hypothetical protein
MSTSRKQGFRLRLSWRWPFFGLRAKKPPLTAWLELHYLWCTDHLSDNSREAAARRVADSEIRRFE